MKQTPLEKKYLAKSSSSKNPSCLSLSAKEILIGCLLSLRPLLLAGALKILAALQLLWNRARSVSGRRVVSSTVRAAGLQKKMMSALAVQEKQTMSRGLNPGQDLRTNGRLQPEEPSTTDPIILFNLCHCAVDVGAFPAGGLTVPTRRPSAVPYSPGLNPLSAVLSRAPPELAQRPLSPTAATRPPR
ncbi:hypothetical protein Q8A67_021061 [Cirrhinus molitorella]|uniref:Uncharacterized protein n=1 Tax=Cirrhinus molitorella TaxID=172907 RepID=A0AA88TFZ0_9TELE|nr:hypothetical protein Q8A67_021061 [Cirrhinus molitorella]